ncbi:O-antigen ligase [Cupriavidus pauculus]|uniref:O-antigen ligase family protein n=1 Tax=Cupriavidus pauculus TaxID=82633 RepID=UPI001EE30563|nr:O-antigen ligase family protein [Cupriavidus pauculus]GJG93601.1 O-antigen ligase family protein [Cupriavidus pauculus]
MSTRIASRYERPLTWIVAALPLALIVPGPFRDVIYGLLGVAGLVLVVRQPQIRQVIWQHKWLFAAFLSYIPFSAAHILLLGSKGSSMDNAVHYLLYALMGTCAIVLPRRMREWCIGLAVAALVACAVLLVQRFCLDIVRPYGTYGFNPVTTTSGAIKFALSMVVIALLMLAFGKFGRVTPGQKGLLMGIGVLTVVCAALTQSRAPMLVAIIVVCVLGWLNFTDPVRRGKRWRGALIAVSVVVAAFAVIALYGPLRDRMESTVTEVQLWAKGKTQTSTGQRLSLWNNAAAIFKSHPVAGVGLGHFGDASRELIAEGKAPPDIGIFDHAHNEYLCALATGGLIGLAQLLWMFGAPIVYFLGRFREARRNGACVAWQAAGLAAALSFPLFAFTDCVFDRQVVVSFYVFAVFAHFWAVEVQRAGAGAAAPATRREAAHRTPAHSI